MAKWFKEGICKVCGLGYDDCYCKERLDGLEEYGSDGKKIVKDRP